MALKWLERPALSGARPNSLLYRLVSHCVLLSRPSGPRCSGRKKYSFEPRMIDVKISSWLGLPAPADGALRSGSQTLISCELGVRSKYVMYVTEIKWALYSTLFT